jgi:outer membrane protein assembly factor BamB
MIALKPGEKGSEPALVWKLTKGTAYVPTPLAKDGYLYWVDDKVNVAICAQAKTGKEVWSERLGSDSVSASMVMADGKIYVVNEKGTVFVYPAKPEFEMLAKNELNEGVFATPAIADGKLFIRGQKHLYCFAKK